MKPIQPYLVIACLLSASAQAQIINQKQNFKNQAPQDGKTKKSPPLINKSQTRQFTLNTLRHQNQTHPRSNAPTQHADGIKATNAVPITLRQSQITPIAEIQGAGAVSSPLVGQTVTTRGVVTAVYKTGGFDGYYIQTPGSGGVAKAPADASDGLFIYAPKTINNAPKVGECVDVSGKISEYGGNRNTPPEEKLTELTEASHTIVASCEAVKPTELTSLPATDAEKEAYEGMLVQPVGTYTITNNFELNRYGQIGLAFDDQVLPQATDVVSPGAEAEALEADNLKKYITLDDGSSWDYTRNKTAQKSPLPYLSQETPMRTGTQVTFTKPVILEYRFQWNFQPTEQVVGSQQNFLQTSNTRPTTPPNVEGDIKIATFNVLNYFTDLGENEEGCQPYKDREGNPVTNNRCKARGAYTQKAFEHQQEKIVNAINSLNADIVGLMEIETSSQFNHPRDESLQKLVDALNAADPDKAWALVPSNMAQVPASEDVIRIAFIYQQQAVAPVDSSLILQDPAFANARQPLAQKFKKADAETQFVLIANHFKSKGSGDDDGTGQGLSNPSRKEQARALTQWANDMFADTPVLLLGDFNTYSREEPIQIIESNGYQNVETDRSATFQFSGRHGSLDHIFANKEARTLVGGSAVWHINSNESIAMQYSRENYNITNLYTDGPWASSDHDPVIIGLNIRQNNGNNGNNGNQPDGPPSPNIQNVPASSPLLLLLSTLALGFLGFRNRKKS